MGALLVFVAVVLFLVLYTFSSFAYSVEEEALVIRWRVLGLPFNKRVIPRSRIKAVRPFRARTDLFPGFEIWGTLLRGNASIIELESGLLRKVFITPPDAEVLGEQIVTSGVVPGQ